MFRAFPVHISALVVLELRMKTSSRLRRVQLALKPMANSVTTKSTSSPQAANMLNVAQTASWGMELEGSTTDMALGRN